MQEKSRKREKAQECVQGCLLQPYCNASRLGAQLRKYLRRSGLEARVGMNTIAPLMEDGAAESLEFKGRKTETGVELRIRRAPEHLDESKAKLARKLLKGEGEHSVEEICSTLGMDSPLYRCLQEAEGTNYTVIHQGETAP